MTHCMIALHEAAEYHYITVLHWLQFSNIRDENKKGFIEDIKDYINYILKAFKSF